MPYATHRFKVVRPPLEWNEERYLPQNCMRVFHLGCDYPEPPSSTSVNLSTFPELHAAAACAKTENPGFDSGCSKASTLKA